MPDTRIQDATTHGPSNPRIPIPPWAPIILVVLSLVAGVYATDPESGVAAVTLIWGSALDMRTTMTFSTGFGRQRWKP